MLPANQSSPNLRQRFIELYNAGSVTIPGFGACEVTGSERPEDGGTVTPDGGRTVLLVRRSIVDDPCVSVINGPCEIPVGKYGRPGTMDSPMLALTDMLDTSLVAGDAIGIEAGSFVLVKGHCGYVAIGDPDKDTETWRVAKQDNCQADSMMVRATECIYPGEGGSVQPQQWNSITECWEDTSGQPVEIIDPMGWLLAVPDDCFKVDRQRKCGTTSSVSYMPSFPFGMTQLVRVPLKIECGDCGEVEIIRKAVGGSGSGSGTTDGHCDTEATECKFQACNMSYRPLSCDAPEYAIAHIIPGECCLPSMGSGEERCIAFLIPYPRPLFGIGTVPTGSKMCGDTPSLEDVGFLDACADYPGTAPIGYSNPMNLHACAESKVLLLWCTQCSSPSDMVADSCGWVAVQVEDAELPDWILDLRCLDGAVCGIEKKYKTYNRYGHFCECDNDTDTWDATSLTFDEITYVVGADYGTAGAGADVLTDVNCGVGVNSCSLIFNQQQVTSSNLLLKTKTACVLCAKIVDDADIEGPTWALLGGTVSYKTITGTEVDVLTDLEFDTGQCTGSGSGSGAVSLNFTGKTTRICVFCGTPSAGDDVVIPLPFQQVELMGDANFICTSCPELEIAMFTAFVLCPTTPAWEDAGNCECDPCVTGSGSGSGA